MFFAVAEQQWRGRDRRKLSFNDEEIPRLTSRSCGEFPGIGRTLPSRHLRHLIACLAVGEPEPEVCASRALVDRLPQRRTGWSRSPPSSGSCRRHYDPCEPLYTVGFWAPLAVYAALLIPT